MTEHVLVWHPKGPGEAPAGGDDQLRLIGMPTGLVRPARQALAADQLALAIADAGSLVGDDAPFADVVSKRWRKKAQPAGTASAEVHAMSDGSASGLASSGDDAESDAPTHA